MWLNKTVKLMWPHYASALSRLTIQALEPILNRCTHPCPAPHQDRPLLRCSCPGATAACH